MECERETEMERKNTGNYQKTKADETARHGDCRRNFFSPRYQLLALRNISFSCLLQAELENLNLYSQDY